MTARRAAHEPVAVLDHACRYEREPLARPDGFDEGMVEKVLHLVHLLNGLNSHPALSTTSARWRARTCWRTVSVDDVDFDSTELARQLGPALRTRQPPEQKTLAEYGARLVDECRRALSIVLPFTDAERALLDLLLDRGEVDASILTSDMTLRERIQAQPLLEWKALNVRRHRGLS